MHLDLGGSASNDRSTLRRLLLLLVASVDDPMRNSIGSHSLLGNDERKNSEKDQKKSHEAKMQQILLSDSI